MVEVERYVYEDSEDAIPVCDIDGFWTGRIKNGARIYRLSDLLSDDIGCGILVGEGDCGKSFFIEMFAREVPSDSLCCRIALRDFANEQSASIEHEIESCHAKKKKFDECRRVFVFIDGLDERPAFVGLMGRLMRKYSGREDLILWIATRKIDGLDAFQKEIENLKFYKLAPFSETDVKNLAEFNGVDGAAFVAAARKFRVADVCAKPGGCLSCLRVYRRNGNVFSDTINLLHEVSLDLCSAHRDGATISVEFSVLRYTGEELVEAASWLAAVQILQGKQSLHCGDFDSLPTECLLLRDWTTPRYDRWGVAEVLRTRLFEPFGQLRLRFSVPRLPYYLAARWLRENVSKDNLAAILISSGKLLSREVQNVVAWLEVFDPGFAAPLVGDFPEMLLGCEESLKKQDPAEYYQLLEDRYSKMTDEARTAYMGRNLSSLAGLGYEAVVHARLERCDISYAEVSFAIDVATYAGIDIAADLINIVIDDKRDINSRRKASYELPSVCKDASERQRKSLRGLLGVTPASIHEETILGNVLSVLWPNDMTPEELVRELRSPGRHIRSSYEDFCRRDLPATFEKALTASSIKVFLRWAVDFVADDKTFDYMGELAREIFTCAWKFIGEDGVAELMAHCVEAVYIKKHYVELPFADENDSRYSKVSLLDPGLFSEDIQGRMKVLLALIEHGAPGYALLEHLHVSPRYQLIGINDFHTLVDRLKYDSQHSHGLVRCLRQLAWQVDEESCREDFEWLSSVYPEVKEFSLQFIAEQRRDFEKKSAGWQREREAREKKYAAQRSDSRQKTLEHLSKDDLNGSCFFRVSELISSDDWSGAVPKLHLLEAPGAKELNDEQIANLAKLAFRFLTFVKPIEDKHDATGIYVASALVLLYERRAFDVDAIPRSQWVVLLRHLFGCAYQLKDDEVIGRIAAHLVEKIPDEVDLAFRESVRCFYREEFTDPVPWWIPRMTRSQFDWILGFISTELMRGNQAKQLLSELLNFGDRVAVEKVLQSIVDPRASEVLDDERKRLLSFAFSLMPKEYADRISRLMHDHSQWFDKWFGDAVYYQELSSNVILSCGPDFVYNVCDWLISRYPSANRPKRDCSYTVEIIDEIYFFIDGLIAEIWQTGRKEYVDVLERLSRKFPDQLGWKWILAKAMECMQNGLSSQAIISEADLRTLGSSKQDDGKLLVPDSAALQKVVYDALRRFGEYIQSELLPVRALWNEVPLRLWCQKKCDRKHCARVDDNPHSSIVFPRDESCLSDAVAIYLNAVMKDWVINREPLASPISYYGSMRKSGFVDVKVECLLPTGNICTVFVEVKCNFNPTIKNSIGPQLLDKYVKSKPGSAGILLCGCYSASDWIDCDHRKSKIQKDYKDVATAQRSLEDQHKAVGGPIMVLAIDCGLR